LPGILMKMGMNEKSDGHTSPNKYYMLECYTPSHWEDSALICGIQLPNHETFTRGRRVGVPILKPIEIKVHTNHCDKLLELDKTQELLMTRRLLKALQNDGVNNLDVYETVIRHPETGFVTNDYIMANLIGLVKAVDLSGSNIGFQSALIMIIL
jgi:hypothetical protein